MGNTQVNNYAHFDGLVHGAHWSAVDSILSDNYLDLTTVVDASVLRGTKAVWLAPNSSKDSRYGGTIFHIPLDILENKHLYWIEVNDYQLSQAASRISLQQP